jgi:hypothetical protein
MAKRPQPDPVASLSAEEARAIVLRAQGLSGDPIAGGVPGVLRQLGAVQLDTISVLARSHELVPYARLGSVGRKAAEAAYWAQPPAAFEYRAHAECILPIEMWPFFAFRRRAWGAREDWTEIPEAVYAEVRAALRDGPVTASDLGGARNGAGWWSWSEAKMAIEWLQYRGEVVCTTRRGWKRVYDLPERVVPAALLASEPTDAECFLRIVREIGRALGVATRKDIADCYLLTRNYAGRAQNANALIDAAIAESGLLPVAVEGWAETAYAYPWALEPAPAGSRTTLLSPFDSLIWDRDRTERLFGLRLRIEAYTPKAQRVHGYFSMPLLADGRLAGRADPAREGRTLVGRTVSVDSADHVAPMAAALRDAASWVGCDDVRVDEVRPPALAKELRRALA